MFDYSLLLLFPAAMAFAGAMDMLTMTIPNRVSLLLLGAFLVAVPAAGLGLDAFLNHLGAGLLVFVVGFAIFAAGWIGGGDVKLLAASALWIGLDNLFPYLFLVTILGGQLALIFLVLRGYFPEGSVRAPVWLLRLQAKETGVPYGLAIAGAALWLYPSTMLFKGLAF
ncbi:MAG: prepilin peptidase [Hyphomicrobiaceae bacterium]|nr:prepilin peptidase [Hyphomicrobiaceae bacterium]